MAKHSKLISTLIIVILISTLFNFQSVASIVKISENIEEKEFDGYIITFNDESVFDFKNKFSENIKNILSHASTKSIELEISAKVQEHKDKLIQIHEKAKEDIKNILGGDKSIEDFLSNENFDLLNMMVIKDLGLDIIEKLEELPYIKKITPNYKFSITIDESVPLINADDVWNMQDSFGSNITGKNITIAILDTGVNYNHPDLKDNYIANGSYDYVNGDNDPMDDHGHGTHCTGIAVGRGNGSNYQYIGVAPDAKFYSLKIIASDGSGTLDNYKLAMKKAVSLGVDVVSMSFGTPGPGVPTDEFCIEADDTVDAGVVVVTAAGNLGSYRNITSPGCAQKVITVGATDKSDNIAYFSSRGPVEWDGNYMIKPDVVAPGVSITSTDKDGTYSIKHGTSMSTPHVAGAAALILQAHPDFEPQDVKDLLKDTAVDLGYDENTQGGGRIDLLRALGDEDIIFIEAPDQVYENNYFTVKLTNRTGAPVKAWVLFSVPFHFPRIKYGSDFSIKSPRVFRLFKDNLVGTIKVFTNFSIKSIFTDNYDVKKELIIRNT